MPFCDFTLFVAQDVLKTSLLRRKCLCENPLNLGEHLKNRRLRLGLSQEQVAAQLGTLREVYERWERNERQPVVSVWPSILAFLGYYPGQVDARISDLVLKIRRITGLDQKELAKRVGTSHQRLRDWEHERQQPSVAQIRRLKEIAEAVRRVVRPT